MSVEWLKDIRKQAGLAQVDVAHLANVKRASYGNIELGVRRPSVSTAKRIAVVLGFEWTRFFEESENGGGKSA